MRQFLFLLLSCFFSVPVLALFNDAPTAFSASKANPSLFETSTDTFLPLEKAYRLAISINNEQKKIYLDWDIADDYYLYRHRFAVELFVDGQAVASSAVYEPGLVAYDEYYERELEKFYRHTRIEVNHDQAMLSGLSLRVGFQGCADAGLCYPPEYWNYRYKADSGVFVRAAADLSAQPGHEQFLKGVSTVEVIEGGDRARFALMLLFAFLGGLLLNLMPCVFPVLSIKVMSFATHAMRPAVLHRHGWSYTLGVISSLLVFVGILLALKAAGKAVGWGFQLQSPVFVGLLVYLFFMLGLSFSGVLSFGERLMNLGSSLGKGNGYSSSFMTGALAVVVASPCSAPFMGVAMGYALTQNSFETVFIFVFLGFGLAFPFLLLSYLPSLLNRLPRPGLWMVKLRKLLAYPLYLSSIWLLWVLSHQLGSKAVASVVAGCVLLFIGALLSRRPLVKLSGPSPRWILPVALVLAVVPFGSPLFSIHSLKPLSAPLNTTEWQVYSEERLEQLLAQKQPVFVNLTADWCITCLANEKNALSSDAFYQALDRKGVHYLKGDWTSYNPAITRLLSAFGRSGVPLYLLFDSEGKVVVLPQLLRESVVLEYIDSL